MRSSAPLVCACAALVACQPDPPAELEIATACPIDQPVRLVPAPDDFVPVRERWYALHVFGDDILYTFDPFDSGERLYSRLNRCTGDLQPYRPLAPGLHNPFTIAAPGGRVLYANDAQGTKYIVDRLDDPGDDEPIPVPGLPYDTGLSSSGASSLPYAHFTRRHEAPLGTAVSLAAGLGGHTFAAYTHNGDRDTPVLQLADDLVAHTVAGDHRILLHDTGELRRVDPLTGTGELLLTEVRFFQRLASVDKILWQRIGDDIDEPVYLHDLQSGVDTLIATNKFAHQSWYRDADHPTLGQWAVTQTGAALVFVGPDDLIVRAVRTDTGDPLGIPEHLRLRGAFGGAFGLELETDPELVHALWDPLTGDLREWYRGPPAEVRLRFVDGDLAEYYLPDSSDAGTGSLWRVDLRTGDASKIVPRTNTAPSRITDTHYFVAFDTGLLPGPPHTAAVFSNAARRDLKLIDSTSGLYTPIADDVSAYGIIHGEGLLYLDAHGPDPGIWAYPLPFE